MSPRAHSTEPLSFKSQRGWSQYHKSGESPGGGIKDTQLSPRRIRAWMGAELLLCPWKILPCSPQDTIKTKLGSSEHCKRTSKLNCFSSSCKKCSKMRKNKENHNNNKNNKKTTSTLNPFFADLCSYQIYTYQNDILLQIHTWSIKWCQCKLAVCSYKNRTRKEWRGVNCITSTCNVIIV